ncbi:uncharacterized protein LOC121870084 [Homarus americanus]|nr:uncharacterized protein LOC121870084 [Homarus americanus]
MPEVPVLTGLQGRYRVGDTLNITCTARDARPPAILSFYVNGKLIHPGSGRVQELATTEGTYYGVYNTRSRLILPLSERHVPTITLECQGWVLTLETQIAATMEVNTARAFTSYFNTGAGTVVPCLASVLLIVAITHLLTTSS